MTPEEAQGLLDGATPGPWQVRGDGPTNRQLHVCDCEERAEVAESVTWENAPLIAAAPALAELVAGLYVEYAVQDTYTGLYVREKDDGQLGGAAEPSDADWWQDAQACADYVKFLNENPKQTVRMVSRLVSEVAE